MSANETVIKVENLGKDYRLGVINHGMLYRDLQSWFARWRGRPDPNAKIKDVSLHQREQHRMRDSNFLALDGVSFEVKQGDTLGIVGRNGAGKSTLLKLLSRITQPTRGSIKMRGHAASLLEVGTGFHPELTGRENIFLNGAILGMSRSAIQRNLEAIVDFSEIEQFIDTPVKRYSSGMYVRLAFAVAAHLEPEILIVDEVLAVGDIAFQRKCLGKMQSVQDSGRTVLFVSHNLTAVSKLCSRCILLSGGRLVADGSTAEVLNEYVSAVSSNRKPSREYSLPDSSFEARIRRVSVIRANGRIASTTELTEKFSIEIDYELAAPVEGLSVGLQIISVESDLTVVSLSDPELEWSRLDARNPGYYTSRVEFPPDLFNTGLYQVRVGMSAHGKIFHVIEDIFFEVIDNIGIMIPLGQERKNSVLALRLPWPAERQEDKAHWVTEAHS
ncbi:MAG TPA: ABC transporter ATP-binding protein [Rhizomicrobium sp.]|nr:ABC transporter ATP-binding protein [Rhizomicrobium sp.]